LQNTMALSSLLSTFSEILTCRSSSSREKPRKKRSRASSRHLGPDPRARTASRSSTRRRLPSEAVSRAAAVVGECNAGVVEGGGDAAKGMAKEEEGFVFDEG
jgi:hypothetical protein